MYTATFLRQFCFDRVDEKVRQIFYMTNESESGSFWRRAYAQNFSFQFLTVANLP